MSWAKKCFWEIWKGILSHLGSLILIFVLSGGYIYAINTIKKFQEWVRSVPTDYILTPFVILIILLVAVLRIYFKQRKQLNLVAKPPGKEGESRFVTHFGVWWKIYPDSDYIEDFPYCPCCDPKQKLIMKEWVSEEIYKCPKTGTEVKLFEVAVWEKEKVLENLYRTYFSGSHWRDFIYTEYKRIKQLDPNKKDHEILSELFAAEPLNRIPHDQIEAILRRFASMHEVVRFMLDNYKSYRKYIHA
jgi:hypothetical protein